MSFSSMQPETELATNSFSKSLNNPSERSMAALAYLVIAWPTSTRASGRQKRRTRYSASSLTDSNHSTFRRNTSFSVVLVNVVSVIPYVAVITVSQCSACSALSKCNLRQLVKMFVSIVVVLVSLAAARTTQTAACSYAADFCQGHADLCGY